LSSIFYCALEKAGKSQRKIDWRTLLLSRCMLLKFDFYMHHHDVAFSSKTEQQSTTISLPIPNSFFIFIF